MSSYQIKNIVEDDDIGQIIRNEITTPFCENFILVGPENTCLPMYFANFAESIKHFELRNSDIMVCTYPKSGTTWVQEMVWLIANDLDFEGAKANLLQRFPFIEVCGTSDYEKIGKALGMKLPEIVSKSVEFIERQESPRFIKTHLPFSLLPQEIQNGTKSPKIIYAMRNPKDVCVSYYHHGRLLHGWRANLENFSKVFLAGKIMYGSLWKHVLGYWNRRSSPNLLIIKYEDMKGDLPSVIQKTAKFLDKNLTEEQVIQLSHHLSFESMKNNKAVNYENSVNLMKKLNLSLEEGTFIRSGTVGKYKEELSSVTIAKFDAWIRENIADTTLEKE